MKKINLKGLDRDCYTEKFSNGLEVFMIPCVDKKNYYISYATRYGSDVLEFNDYKTPLGVAHFLEHKMFEQEDGTDPFTFFSNSGTDSNASTSYDNTQYICCGTKNFNPNLRYLLKFVNSPYYTDKNVDKEKGIIAEEINMYKDIPDCKLELKLRECLYQKHPRRIDIAGTVEEINKITKEDLYKCYNNFYIPNNMFILIVGNFDQKEAIDIIREELEKKEKKALPKIKKVTEPTNINEKSLTLEENIEVPKIAVGIKIPTKKISYDDIELDLYLSMLTSIIFGPSSDFREKVRQNKLLNSIYTEWENIDGIKTFYLMANTQNPDELIKEIEKELQELKVEEKDFNRIKKVWIANEVKIYDNVDMIVNNTYDDLLKYKKIIPNRIDIIKKMKFSTLKDIIKDIDLKNKSIVKMISKE